MQAQPKTIPDILHTGDQYIKLLSGELRVPDAALNTKIPICA
jgi:hypothetical protein